MFYLHVHNNATRDIKHISIKDMDTAKQLAALIEQIRNDQDLLDRLTQNNYGINQTANFNVSQWYGQQRQDRNLWRLKDWDLINQGLQYRIVYAFTPINTYHVLAVLHRNELDYDDETNLYTSRIISDYDEL